MGWATVEIPFCDRTKERMTGGKCPLKPVLQPENPERRSWVLLECCRLGWELPAVHYPLSCRGKSATAAEWDLRRTGCAVGVQTVGGKKASANTVVCLGTHWDCCTGLLWTGGRWPLGWGKPKLTALSNIGIGHVWSNKQQLRKRWIETIAIQSVCLKWLIR